VRREDVITGSDSTCCVVDDDQQVIGIINPMSYRKGIEFRAADAMLTEIIAVRSGMRLNQVFREIGRQDRLMVVVTTDGSLDADRVLGVLNPFSLTRVMANAAQIT